MTPTTAVSFDGGDILQQQYRQRRRLQWQGSQRDGKTRRLEASLSQKQQQQQRNLCSRQSIGVGYVMDISTFRPFSGRSHLSTRC